MEGEECYIVLPPVLDINQKFMEPGQFPYFWFLSSWIKSAVE